MITIYKASIWSPGVIPPGEWKFRHIKRVMLPIIDMLYIFSGYAAVFASVKTIGEFFSWTNVNGFGWAMIASGALSLIGTMYPKLWPVEMLARSMLLGLMTSYIVATALLTFSGDESKTFVLTTSAIALLPLIWRLAFLGSEWQSRKLERRGRHG